MAFKKTYTVTEPIELTYITYDIMRNWDSPLYGLDLEGVYWEEESQTLTVKFNVDLDDRQEQYLDDLVQRAIDYGLVTENSVNPTLFYNYYDEELDTFSVIGRANYIILDGYFYPTVSGLYKVSISFDMYVRRINRDPNIELYINGEPVMVHRGIYRTRVWQLVSGYRLMHFEANERVNYELKINTRSFSTHVIMKNVEFLVQLLKGAVR